jgi:hypothetical protein
LLKLSRAILVSNPPPANKCIFVWPPSLSRSLHHGQPLTLLNDELEAYMKFTNRSGQNLVALEISDGAGNLVTLNNIQPNETRVTELAPNTYHLVAHTLYIAELDVDANSTVVLNAEGQLVLGEDLVPVGPSGKV